ncbi:uncharacterized protein [Drosophila virilis]|uniref:RNA polymerase II-associated factor 1 homolog n=1 Tax=Drosophila virilis TaxID=7244 RepID=B4LVA4_DROVI|nr:uncharacterized protein LOC6628200 isoform X2 [Drosophila virilis]EDW64364.2 uncharacterized protein Dvir_GJ17433, isoform C [Drosophila virilis]
MTCACFSLNMAALELGNKSKKKDDKLNKFICPITYTSQLPDPTVGCKFLPCGKTLLDFTTEPVSFPQLETQFSYQFKGLQLLFDIDLVNPSVYAHSSAEPMEMDPKDAALLADIEALHINNQKPKALHSFPTRAQECRELFAKERTAVPRPRAGLQRLQPEPEHLELESFSLEQQKQIVQQTFVDIEKPLGCHPTKSASTARPVAQLPIFPEANYAQYEHELVQVQFGIPPSGNSNGLLKDCGNYLINFKVKPEPLFKQIQHTSGQSLVTYLAEERYKEERTADSADRGERFMLREKDGSIYYQAVSKHIKLRKERPSPQATANVCLLIKRTKDTPQQPSSGTKK